VFPRASRRTNYKRGKLPPHRKEKLESVKFTWSLQSRTEAVVEDSDNDNDLDSAKESNKNGECNKNEPHSSDQARGAAAGMSTDAATVDKPITVDSTAATADETATANGDDKDYLVEETATLPLDEANAVDKQAPHEMTPVKTAESAAKMCGSSNDRVGTVAGTNSTIAAEPVSTAHPAAATAEAASSDHDSIRPPQASQEPVDFAGRLKAKLLADLAEEDAALKRLE
jgi:hypothetical protein